jgi:hypothetical protein
MSGELDPGTLANIDQVNAQAAEQVSALVAFARQVTASDGHTIADFAVARAINELGEHHARFLLNAAIMRLADQAGAL